MIKTNRFIQVAMCTLFVVSLFFFGNKFGHAEENSVVVKKGDTLFSISKQYSLSVQALKKYNGLKHNTIYVGQKMRIPNFKQAEPFYVIIAGSYTKKSNAEAQISLLKKKRMQAVLVKKVINNYTYYRVQAGVFANKNNAEKQSKLLQHQGFSSYISTEKLLHINGITTGSMYNEPIYRFGKPSAAEDHLNIRSLYYNHHAPGVRVNFNTENGSVLGLQAYPAYLHDDAIPTIKDDILRVYGYPNEVKEVTCYESATCELYIYTFNKNKLTVRIDRDGKTVQYVELGTIQ